jgi:cysteinyl-tRNA synthetase
MNFNFEGLDSSQSFVEKLNKKYQEFKASVTDADSVDREKVDSVMTEFWGFLENDLATPRALATLSGVLKSKEFNNHEKSIILQEMDEVLGLLWSF